MTSSWFTMSTTRSPSIPASLEYLISTSCSKLSQSVDIISHVKYRNLLRKKNSRTPQNLDVYFSHDMPHISCTYTRSLCPNEGTYWFHAKLPNNIQAVANIWPHLRNEEYVGYRMVLCNQLLHTFVTIWLVLSLFLNTKQYTGSCQYMTAFKKRRICGVSYGTLQPAFAYFCDNLAGFVSISEKRNRSAQSICVCHQYKLWLITAYCRLVTYTNTCPLSIESQQLIICSLELK